MTTEKKTPFATIDDLAPGDIIYVKSRIAFEKSRFQPPAKAFTVLSVNKETFTVHSSTEQPIVHSMVTGEPIIKPRNLMYTIYRADEDQSIN